MGNFRLYLFIYHVSVYVGILWNNGFLVVFMFEIIFPASCLCRISRLLAIFKSDSLSLWGVSLIWSFVYPEFQISQQIKTDASVFRWPCWQRKRKILLDDNVTYALVQHKWSTEYSILRLFYVPISSAKIIFLTLFLGFALFKNGCCHLKFSKLCHCNYVISIVIFTLPCWTSMP